MNSQSSETEGKNKADQRQDTAFPVKVKEGVISAGPASSEGMGARTTAYWEKRQYWVQATIAVVGAISVAIYAFQLYEMRKATKAATEGLALTREMNRLDQRPWVTASGGTLLKAPLVGEKVTVMVALLNSGKTPALETRGAGKVFITGAALSQEKFLFDTSGPEVSRTVVGPTSTTHVLLHTPEPLTEAQFQSMKSGEYQLFCTGFAEYWDISGRPHKTTFCYQLTLEDWVPGQSLQSCGEGNKVN